MSEEHTLRWSLVLTGLLIASTASAAPPEVHFDVAPLSACRDVTSAEFAVANPGERLIEATVEVSSLLVTGRESDLDEYLIRCSSPNYTLRVEDYSPKTVDAISKLNLPAGVDIRIKV